MMQKRPTLSVKRKYKRDKKGKLAQYGNNIYHDITAMDDHSLESKLARADEYCAGLVVALEKLGIETKDIYISYKIRNQ